MSSNPMDGSPSAFHRENCGSSSQNPPREGDSIINSDEENHKSINTDSTGKKSIFPQYLERLGIEDAALDNASQESYWSRIQDSTRREPTGAKINKGTLKGRNHQITRLVIKNNLPSQASTESVCVPKFTYFLMGMPPSVDDFPPNPTQDEEEIHIHWVKIHAKHIKTHFKHLDMD
ncbi:hypothetical protein O181_001440 [Austropuccinia psidii MF-1]|uniref:Uncharacterized protein n=1 Tax=Austropuccinia psidii MF-1 TaxID=1389203 RepID=A0A9Q3GBU3_9BASI|nr:hypothetical protein [Austropuccinia psidii MF-1]